MAQPVEIQNVRFEHHRHQQALGLGTSTPRVSWNYRATNSGYCHNWVQTAYDIEISRGPPVSPGQPKPLHPVVRVRGYDNNSAPTAWSTATSVEAGLLKPSDWCADFITSNVPADPKAPRPPVAFDIPSRIQRARVYATAHGLYELCINKQRVGDQVLAPGWTDYHTRLEYQTYDVTLLLRAGSNTLVAEVAEGWFAGRLGYSGGDRNIWGVDIAFSSMLAVDYTDGQSEVLARTDREWKWAKSPTVCAEIYLGSTILLYYHA